MCEKIRMGSSQKQNVMSSLNKLKSLLPKIKPPTLVLFQQHSFPATSCIISVIINSSFRKLPKLMKNTLKKMFFHFFTFVCNVALFLKGDTFRFSYHLRFHLSVTIIISQHTHMTCIIGVVPKTNKGSSHKQ